MRHAFCMAVLAVGATVLVAAPAWGEEPWQRVQLVGGMRELSLWGALDVDERDQVWLWLAGDVGFMVSPRHELGPSLNLQLWVFDWETDAGGSCGGFYRYHVPVRSQRVAPFVGVRVLGFLGDQREWSGELRAEAGFWHFMTESTAITVTGYYGRRLGPRCDPWSCPDDRDRVGMSLGLSVFF